MKSQYLLLVAVHLGGLALRAVYEPRWRQGRSVSRPRLTFLLVFVAMTAMWMSWFIMVDLDPLPLPLPDLVRQVGLGLVVLGVATVLR